MLSGLLFTLFFSVTIFGQTVTIGSGTNVGNKLPVVPYSTFSFSEQIILKSEIATTGTISKIRFYRNATAIPNSTNWTIYLGHTSKTAFASNSDWIQSGAMTQVFSGSVSASPAAGWMEITLTTPFLYNNIDNLVIAIDENEASFTNTTANYCRIWTTPLPNRGIYYESDFTNPNPATINLTGTRTTYINQIQLEFAVLCSGAPTGGTVTVSPTSGQTGSTYGVSATGYTTGTGLTYQWQYSDTGGAPWTNQGVAANSYSALTGMVAPAFGVVRTWRLVVTCTASASSANSTTGTFTSTYCMPTTAGGNTYYISNFTTTGATTNINNSSGGSTTGYQDFSGSVSGSAVEGSTINYSVSVAGGSNYGRAIWIDLNNNGTFEASEQLVSSTSYSNSPLTGSFTIPMGTASGSKRMRVVATYIPNNPSNPCSNSGTGEYEDYSITILPLSPCTTPTAQPTNLILNPTSTTITGSFTAASPAPNSYLVVVSTNATAPMPVNGTTYTIGGTLGAGYTVVDTDPHTTFTATGLSPSTLYYVYVFSYNHQCTGGPRYNFTNPLTASITTLAVTYCQPTSEQPQYVYINDVRFLGTLNDVDNLNSGYSDGYQNWTARPKAIQAQGEGINVYYRNISDSRTAHVKAWVDWNKNGTFDAGELVYDTGDVSTSSATFGFIIPPGTPPGDYRIRIRNNTYYDTFWGQTFPYDFNPCEDFLYYYDPWFDTYEFYDGEAEDYLFTVISSCDANVLTVTNGENCGPGTVNLSVTGTASASGYKWYSAETGGTLLATTASGNWSPNIASTTIYWVTAISGTCESLKRTKIVAKIKPLPIVSFTPNTPTICDVNETLQLSAGADTETIELINEHFEGAGLGVFSNINNTPNGPPYDAITVWQKQANTYTPNNTEVWSPAISSGINGTHFVMSTSDVNPPGPVQQFLELTASVNASNMTNLILTFDMYYSHFGDQVKVQANSGTGWTDVQVYSASVGIGTRFANQTVSLSAFNNAPTLKIRFQFLSTWGDGVAIDNVQLTGVRPMTASFAWSNSNPIQFYSDAAGTIPYISGVPATVVYIKPTEIQAESYDSWAISATATLTNGCSAVGNTTITNNAKFWNTASTDWNSANWKPNTSVPSSDKCVVIKTPVNILGSTDAAAKNVRIESTGKLNIAANGSLTVTDAIINEATNADLVIASDGNLKQVTDSPLPANSGSVTAKRNIKFRGDDRLEYNYLISPVVGQSLKTIYPGVPTTATYPYVLYHNEATNFFGNSSGAYIPGRALAVKEPSKIHVAAPNLDAELKGPLANGVINFPLAFTDNVTHGYNLVGNPYASNIDLQALYTLNGGSLTNPNQIGKIISTFYFWDNSVNNIYTQQGSGYNGRAYAVFNAYTNIGNAAGHLLTPPQVLGPKVPNKIAKVGQGFMVRGTASGNSLLFNNSIRTIDNTGANFFSKSADATSNRYWLELVTPTGLANSIAVVHFEGGAESFGMDDSPLNVTSSDMLYSIADEHKLQIEGRAPFLDTATVALGSAHFVAANYTFTLGGRDGIFKNIQPIYLKDKLTGTITNLSEGAYTFSAEAGESAGRFEIVYKPGSVLATDSAVKEEVVVYRDGQNFILKAKTDNITSVEIYDAVGRMIRRLAPKSMTAYLDATVLVNGTYILKIEQNNKTTMKKIIK